MFCIAAFVIFGILGIFSARYRVLAKKAWGCVLKKITFKPCDISVQEEIKSRLIGKYIITRPRLAKFIDRFAGAFSWAFVVLSVWSLLIVINSGLNLIVYDTCNPDNPESCSLSGGGCGINSGKPGFWISLKHGQIFTWAKDEVLTFGETVSRVPSRFKTWNPQEYILSSNTYYKPYDENKKTALEIIDPSCKFCAKLFGSIKEANFEDKYNLTYLVYPIPDPAQPNGFRFPHSALIASYLEAAKLNPLKDVLISDDWFKGKNEAQVTVIEYLDFECEACGALYPVTKRISEEFGGQVKFVTRYFPLDGHRNSITSALAAEAAGKQGKFWEMHDKLFENQNTWGESRDSKSYVFEKYAEELGLDMQKFKQDVKLNEARNRIERDRLSGIRLGIKGTPSFFLNGEKIVNPRGYQEFKELIQKALNTK